MGTSDSLFERITSRQDQDMAMSSRWRNPVWPETIELQHDMTPAAWILPRLLSSILDGSDSTPVASVVPSGYPAYVRVLHPANIGGRELPVPWRDVAVLAGRTYHPLMQYTKVKEPGPDATGPARFSDPYLGRLTTDDCRALYATLAAWTSTPETCWLGIWEGNGSLSSPSGGSTAVFSRQESQRKQLRQEFEDVDPNLARALSSWEEVAQAVRRASTFEHPGRSYLLAKGPCASICELGEPPLGITPNLTWPDDMAWCVASEIDFDSTLIAASEECAAALLADERLEVVPVNPEDRLDIGGDVLNRDVGR